MRKAILWLSFLFTVGFATEVTVKGFSSPESAIINDNYVYVSNVGEKLAPSTKDGDGFISKLTKEGKVLNRHFIKGLDAPKGLAIIGNVLYITDVDTLKGFNLSSAKQLFSLTFKESKLLNDLVVKNQETLFVSASDISAIFEVNVANKSYKKLLDFNAANGLHYENGILYAAELGSSHKTMFDAKGKLYKIDLNKNNALTQLANFEGILDGVQKVGSKIYTSDWVNFKTSGVVRVYDTKTKEEKVLGTIALNGAADFIIDEKAKKLYIPQMIGGKLSIIDLD